MKNYSIIRVGNEYILRAGEKSILKTSSKRKAARFMGEAAALLDLSVSPPLSPDNNVEPSIACDTPKVP